MRNKRGIWLISAGLLLIVAALSLVAYNVYDEHRADQEVNHLLTQLETMCPAVAEREPPVYEPVEDPGEQVIPDYLLNPNMDMPVQNIDGEDYIGVITIPSLGLELPVLSEWSYPHLKISPCRYVGTPYLGNFVIAAHNYESHFGTLKYLEEGAKVIFTDVDGNVFTYAVALLETLQPTAVEEMKSGGWDLSLFTCTIGGAYRVTVRCERVEDIPAL